MITVKEWCSVIVVGIVVVGLLLGSIGIFSAEPVEHHTGKVRVAGGNGAQGILLERPNHEIFLLRFDNPYADFTGVFNDIVYVDYPDTIDKYRVHFVKAEPWIDPCPRPLLSDTDVIQRFQGWVATQ